MVSRNTRMLTLRLDLVEDADIIDWLNSLPEGGRSQAVREVLRGGAHAGMTQAGSDLNLSNIRSVVAEELEKALSNQRVHPRQPTQQESETQAEQKYGNKLDQMLGGLQDST